MITIQLEEMGAGEDTNVFWVSLGFKSDISPFDVLFIVCPRQIREQDRASGMDALYYERFDQCMSCYGGAVNIALEPQAITIHFTLKGMSQMSFPDIVRFDASAIPEQMEKACAHLRQMTTFPWGSVIHELSDK